MHPLLVYVLLFCMLSLYALPLCPGVVFAYRWHPVCFKVWHPLFYDFPVVSGVSNVVSVR